MAFEGIKVSQLGYDAENAADQNLLFSSGWPNLKIEKTGTASLFAGVDQDIYVHNLGYPPFFLIEQFDSNGSRIAGVRQRLSDPQYYVTDNKLAVHGGTDITLPTFNIRFYICRLPLDQPFQAPTYRLSGESQGAKKENFGVKVLKLGKNSGSTDLRDYTIHSGTRSPQVHSVTTGALGLVAPDDYELTWVNDLGYNPLFFAFTNNGNVFPEFAGQWFGPDNILGGQELENPTAVSDLTAFSVEAGVLGSIVIFKDPYLPDNPQTVNF